MKNSSDKSIFVSKVQQRNIEGPLETFLLKDAQGRTKHSLFEIKKHFLKKVEIKVGHSLLSVLSDGSPAIKHGQEAISSIPDNQHSPSSCPIQCDVGSTPSIGADA